MPTRPVPYRGAQVAATLLRLVRMEPLGVKVSALRSYLEEEVQLEYDSVEAFERALDRARESLELLGWNVEKAQTPSGRKLVLVESEPGAVRRQLQLDTELTELRKRVLDVLDRLGLNEDRGLLDVAVVMKEHIPRDVIEFTYGRQGQRVSGIPYHWRQQQESQQLLLKTAEGCFAYEITAMRDIRLTERRLTRIKGRKDVPLVAAERITPTDRPDRPRRGRGRSDNVRSLRDASRIAALVRDRARPDGDGLLKLGIDAVAAAVGIGAVEAAEKAEIVRLFDPSIWLEDDSFHVDEYAPQASCVALDGADALAARLELSAVVGLCGAERDLGIQFESSALARYRSELDSFLDRADVSEEVCPCAPAVIAAICERPEVAMGVRLGDSADWRQLQPTDLRLRHWRWRVEGKMDGEPMAIAGLPLAEITEVARET